MALTHVAMSVPAGTLTDAYRSDLLDFYGQLLGWQEIEPLRRPDRLTVSIGGSSYLNVRERAAPMTCHGYEHIGITVESADQLADIWARLDADPRVAEIEPLERADNGFSTFRFRHLLPMAIELQSFP
jgi:hypothetical protein